MIFHTSAGALPPAPHPFVQALWLKEGKCVLR